MATEGTRRVTVNDQTIQGSGAIGLWTKADSLTAFYELTIAVLKEYCAPAGCLMLALTGSLGVRAKSCARQEPKSR
jgi:hypothetical protein